MTMFRKNFENISITSQVIGEKPVFGGNFELLYQTGSRVFGPIFFTNRYYQIVTIENISISSQVIGEKPVFGGHFEFLRPNRK